MYVMFYMGVKLGHLFWRRSMDWCPL